MEINNSNHDKPIIIFYEPFEIMIKNTVKSKINQIIGRAIRYDSHIALPEKERNVTIRKI